MALIRLGLKDFRCFAEADLALSPTSSLVVGPNASGKTSLLEAIHVLGQATSFRAPTLEPLARQGATGFLLTGRLAQASREIPIGVERKARRLNLRLAGAAAGSRADLRLMLDGQPAASRVSRGQGKALAGALLAGQLAGFREVTGQRPTLLIDDLPAELDDEHLSRLWTALAALDAQTVVTAIREDLVPAALRNASVVFHVERIGATDSARVKVI